jgi:(S)-3,5-dihydroxyphenylglycine transaminase
MSNPGNPVLRDIPLNPVLGSDYNDMFSFLNDTAARYPKSISFVAGMPDESFFNVEDQLSAIQVFVDYLVGKTGKERLSMINWIGQYNNSRGIINDVLVKYLACDEGIHVTEKDVLVTVGAQEAFAILVATLCEKDKDVVLMESPGYIGLSAAAKILGHQPEGVALAEDGIDMEKLEKKIVSVNEKGRRVKLLYTIPDYQNPSGYSMSLQKRKALLEMAARYNFLIVEDSVYSSFAYGEERNPTLKSLDTGSRVIYIGSFSKLLFPGMRIGMIVADQQIKNAKGAVIPLIDELEKVKGVFTNNTPGITQAMLAGLLIREQYSLRKINAPKIESYRNKCKALLKALDANVRSHRDGWASGITWNEPEGGFFIKINLPFELDNNDLLLCAEKYGVLFCPMNYFYQDGGGKNEIRLAFSKPTLAEIEEGVKRLAGFLRAKAKALEPLQAANHISY